MADADDLATCQALAEGSSCELEYGTVATLRNRFGFIRCCSRQLDLFFHFGDLHHGLEAAQLSVGLKVQFCPTHVLQSDGVTR